MVAEVFVSAAAGLDLGQLSPKRAQDCSESSICISKCLKTGMPVSLLKDEAGKMRTRLRRELDFT